MKTLDAMAYLIRNGHLLRKQTKAKYKASDLTGWTIQNTI